MTQKTEAFKAFYHHCMEAEENHEKTSNVGFYHIYSQTLRKL
jgi:hypothetical protein